MSATREEFEPSANGAGKIGTSVLRWGEGHFVALYVNGGAVAPLASPALTGTPTAPTASPGTNNTQIATTAYADAAATTAKSRSNHTGTQLAATISDFAAAVAATPAGTSAHVQGTDTGLATGTGNAVTAADLRAHLDDATKHRQINDAATSSTSLWSSSKIAAELEAITIGEVGTSLLADGAVTTAKIEDSAVTAAKLAAAAVTTAKLADAAVTGAKVAGGTATPGNSKYWGTDNLGNFGFHDAGIALKSSLSTGEGELSATGGLHAVLGTTDTRAASGADARFPTSDQKAALAGQTGTPSASNKYLTKAWADADVMTNGDITTGTSTTPARPTPAQLKLAAQTWGAGSGVSWGSAKGSNIASASTIDLGATTGNIVDVTGTTTITSLGTVAAGTTRMVRFTGILTLTHNATSLILPTAANITTAAGDVAMFSSLGSGNWHCAAYLRANGRALADSFVNPLTTRGDLVYQGASAPARLPKGTAGQFLKQGTNDPEWAAPPGGPIGTATISGSGNLSASELYKLVEVSGDYVTATISNGLPANAYFWIYGSSLSNLDADGTLNYNGSTGILNFNANTVYMVYHVGSDVWRVLSTS
jgi:hypothetical protein